MTDDLLYLLLVFGWLGLMTAGWLRPLSPPWGDP